MGKHGNDYARSDRDFYPSPPWVVDALADHVDLGAARIWECAAGSGTIADADARSVHCSDIVRRGYPLDAILDFTSGQRPGSFDWIITNPPGGPGNRIAERFIETGLQHIVEGTAYGLALLLPTDFDSAKTRQRFFGNCPLYVAKIALTQRVVWFERTDGKREAPRENHAWFIWLRRALRAQQSPILLYGPDNRPAAPFAINRDSRRLKYGGDQ